MAYEGRCMVSSVHLDALVFKVEHGGLFSGAT